MVRGRERVEEWVRAQGWVAWDFQVAAWDAYLAGKSGLIQVATGAGKTYAAFLGALAEMIDLGVGQRGGARGQGLHTLYVTPLRAVTRDIELALKRPIEEMGLPMVVESRTGDTSAKVRALQRGRLPHVLLTTPESLCLLLTRENARELFAGLSCLIVDEWHDLLTSKRGSATELALARLRAWNPGMRTWGMSATIPNAGEALATLVGEERSPRRATESHGDGKEARGELGKGAVGDSISAQRHRGGEEEEKGAGARLEDALARRGAIVVRGGMRREVGIACVIPSDSSRLPWAGHLGLAMLPDVLGQLDPSEPTLVFVNTRSQAERWFHAIEYARPEWREVMALHHGSLDREERERVEAGLKDGTIRIVVSTSSLDLGVDFSPVRKVLQIGSPKGIARVVQRAGRANHRPGEASCVWCVPTHALELLEVVAAREAFAEGELEGRFALESPLDVLAQHMVTCALGGGFREEELFAEVRGAWSYRGLSRAEFDWALELVSVGGVLKHYPQFQKIRKGEDGVWRVEQQRVATLHRLNVGTITADGALEIRYVSGKRLGVIDEGFVTHLRVHEKFVFAGKVVQLVGIRDLVVLVRAAAGTTTNTPLWAGTRLPISESLSGAFRRVLERAGKHQASRLGGAGHPEFQAASELIRVQQGLSVVPGAGELLCEVASSREGTHLFVFPFEGRLVHAGAAAVVALRLARMVKGTFSFAVNDYGFEILSADAYPFVRLIRERGAEVFGVEGLTRDVTESVNMSQLARLAFREVARVAGLVMQNYPGARKTGRQVQASSSLIYDVFNEFDPENLLLHQARREVLDRHFERGRLGRTFARMGAATVVLRETARFTPLAFPLVVERVAAKISSESIAERVAKMRAEWGKA